MTPSDPGTAPPPSMGGQSAAIPAAVAVTTAGSGPGEQDGPWVGGGSRAESIAAAVLACRSVTRLTGGVAGEVATYLPGRRVVGVRLRPDGITVHVAGRYGVPVGRIAADVRAAVRAVLDDPSSVPSPAEGDIAANVPIDVVVDDLDMVEDVTLARP